MTPRAILPISSVVLNELSELRRTLPPDLDRTQIDELHHFVENTYAHGYRDGGIRARVEHGQQVEANCRQAELDADAAAHPELCLYPHLLQVAGPEGPRAFREGDYVRLSWDAGTVHDTLVFRDGDWWVDNNFVLVFGRQLDPAQHGEESFPDSDEPTWRAWNSRGDHPLDGPVIQEPAVVRSFRDLRHPAGVYHSCGKVFREHGWIEQGAASTMVCPGQQVSERPVRGSFLVRDDPDA